jgi:hypothetical protein
MLSMPRIVRPDLFRIYGTEIGFPAGLATHQSIKRNKEPAYIQPPHLAGQEAPDAV